MRIEKRRTVRRQPVEVGCPHLRMSIERPDPVVQVVNRKEKNIGLRRGAASGAPTQDNRPNDRDADCAGAESHLETEQYRSTSEAVRTGVCTRPLPWKVLPCQTPRTSSRNC